MKKKLSCMLAVGLPLSVIPGRAALVTIDGALEPLVVTGLARDEGQCLPGSSTVDSVPAETIEEKRIHTVRRTLDLVPNTIVSQAESARVSSFTVRGSHEIPFHELTGGRTGVGFCMDDIPCADAYGRDLAMFAVDRFSFYKGPHGTAFGVPHSMGMIDVTTRPPGAASEGELSFIRGSHDLNQAFAHVSGPVTSNLFLGLDGFCSADEGWFSSRETGKAYGKHQLSSGRARLRWTPNEEMEVNLILGLDHHDDDPVVYVHSGSTRDRYTIHTSPEAYSTGGQGYGGLSFLWKQDGWQFKSITSHRNTDFDDYDPVLLKEVFDPMSTPRLRRQDVSAWTQEFRAESVDPEAELRWRTGIFLDWRESNLYHDIRGLGPWEGLNEIRYRQDDLALYGELTRAFGKHLECSAGLRMQTTNDRTNSTFQPTSFAESLGATYVRMEGEDDFGGILPMAGLAWKWQNGHKSYLRYSAGMQPGGIAVASGGSVNYDSEFSNHFELGHDSVISGSGIECHAAVFYTDYRDYQSFQFNPAGTTIFNAARAHAFGTEGEVRYRPTKEVTFHVGAGFTNARFDEFDSAIGDFKGNRINNIPSGTFNLGCSYHAGWGGMARIDWRCIGDLWCDQGNTVKQGGYSTVDVRIGYEHKGMELALFVDNLFDQEYYSHTYLFQGLPAATPGTPRIVGVEARVKF